MPRPAALTQLPTHGTELGAIHFSLEEYYKSLSATDQLAFLNAIRSGTLFNFNPTS